LSSAARQADHGSALPLPADPTAQKK
jgi:hypothetical protein